MLTPWRRPLGSLTLAGDGDRGKLPTLGRTIARTFVVVLGGLIAGAASFAWPMTTLLSILLLGLATGVVLRWPVTGVMLFAAIATLLPFAVLPVRLVFSPTLVDISLGLVLLSWVLPILHQDAAFSLTSRHALLFLFVGSTIISFLLGNGYATVSAEDARLYVKLLASMLLYVSVTQIVRTEKLLTRVVHVLILGGAGAATIALVVYALPSSTAVEVLSALGDLGYPTGLDVVRTVAGTETVRATGTSVDPNVLGGLLTICALLSAGQALARGQIFRRAAFTVMGAIMLLAAALSYSRGAWVGLAAGLAYLALFKERRLLVVGALGIGFVALLPQAQPFVARLARGLELRDQATLQRLDEYRNALMLIAQYPAFGIGFGGSPTIEIGAGVSSLYLLVAEQTGLVGLAVFLCLIASIAAYGLSTRVPRESTLWGTVAGLQAAVVGALALGLFDHYFFNLRFPHMVALFWLILGLLTVARSAAKMRPAATTRPTLRPPAP